MGGACDPRWAVATTYYWKASGCEGLPTAHLSTFIVPPRALSISSAVWPLNRLRSGSSKLPCLQLWLERRGTYLPKILFSWSN